MPPAENNLIVNFGGELAALGAAFLWAAASVLYGQIGQYLSPLRMNLIKNLVALAMILGVLLPGGGRLFSGIDLFAGILLALSGGIGIGLGDTAYFGALKHIGARRAILLMILSPPITGIFALIFLGENISVGAWLGVMITITGVAWVITERDFAEDVGTNRKTLGIALGLLAAVGQAIGAILSHAAFLHMNISPLRSALLRLIGGTLFVLIFMLVLKDSNGRGYGNLHSFRRWRAMIFTVFIGTFMGIWLQQISLKYAAAGVAQTLFATSPLFVLPIVAVMGEYISLRSLFGAILAIAGVGLIFGLQ
jgi:drug/metabolite transporter (DMT)-like permease